MESVNDMRIKNGLMLLLTAFIWGTAFVAQSVGMDYLEPFTFNGVRSLIGGAALLPCIWILQKLNGRSKDTGTKKDLLTGGLACGVLLFAASSLQQIGIKYTTAGKAGFITAFYIVIVPVMGVFLQKDRLEDMAGSSAGGCGTLFPVYYRVVFCWQRRYSGIFMRTCICGTYPGDRSFCT